MLHRKLNSKTDFCFSNGLRSKVGTFPTLLPPLIAFGGHLCWSWKWTHSFRRALPRTLVVRRGPILPRRSVDLSSLAIGAWGKMLSWQHFNLPRVFPLSAKFSKYFFPLSSPFRSFYQTWKIISDLIIAQLGADSAFAQTSSIQALDWDMKNTNFGYFKGLMPIKKKKKCLIGNLTLMYQRSLTSIIQLLISILHPRLRQPAAYPSCLRVTAGQPILGELPDRHGSSKHPHSRSRLLTVCRCQLTSLASLWTVDGSQNTPRGHIEAWVGIIQCGTSTWNQHKLVASDEVKLSVIFGANLQLIYD